MQDSAKINWLSFNLYSRHDKRIASITGGNFRRKQFFLRLHIPPSSKHSFSDLVDYDVTMIQYHCGITKHHIILFDFNVDTILIVKK